MNDQEIINVTREVDDLLAALCVKHKISPLSLGAVLMARLIWACREKNAESDFITLLQTISSNQIKPSSPTYTQH
jgi:hypothetical protein